MALFSISSNEKETEDRERRGEEERRENETEETGQREKRGTRRATENREKGRVGEDWGTQMWESLGTKFTL